MGLVNRENMILLTVKRLVEAKFDFIVVGGYAVSGLARHRFSVDCDIVISEKNLPEIEKVLEKEGFEKNIEQTGFDKIYSGIFLNYKKKVDELPISFDLLVNSLSCRETGATWSFDYLKNYSVEVDISGFESSIRCRSPEKDLLFAIKIHSGRKTDIRDLIMLKENLDINKVVNHIKRGHLESLRSQIKMVFNYLEDKNLINSLKGVFSLTKDVVREIEDTKKLLNEILRRLNI